MRLPIVSGVVTALLLVGTASADEGYTTWYGPGFQGNRMANGQVFDMNDPTTTASNQYPFGTWLKVTNPHNGKSIFVQVRDRGGFGHALDLSKAAFFALDPPNGWGFRVRYEVVPGPSAVPTAKPEPPKPPEPTPTPPPAPTSRPAAPTPSSPSVGILAPVAPTTTTPQPATPAAQATAPAASPTPTRAPDAASAAITPAGSPTVAQLTKAPEPSARSPRPSPAGTHVVEAGETLHAIARLRDVQVAQLLDLNPLENADRLRIGQVLRLPTTFRIYVVKPGDTLGEIAEAVGVDSSAVLMKANGLDDTLILPGQELKIPS